MSAGVFFITVTSHQAGQRLDNFLRSRCKALPRDCLYRLIRKGNVRVNKKRIPASYRLQVEDIIRVPPFNIDSTGLKKKLESQPADAPCKLIKALKSSVLYEDAYLLILNKPAGIPVHAGSRTRWGVIETLRSAFLHDPYLELVHRLDRATSGCLVMAKSPQALKACHALWRAQAVHKHYLCLVKGLWPRDLKRIDQALAGKACLTQFRVSRYYKNMTLIEAVLSTGRKHQIRQHTAWAGYPVVLDNQYGDFAFNRQLKKQYGFQRLFLHAERLSFCFTLHNFSQAIDIKAPLDPKLIDNLERLT